MSVLDEIVAGVRVDLAERESAASLADLRAALADVDPARDPMPHFRAPGSSVIAEVKRAVPARAPRGHPRPGRPPGGTPRAGCRDQRPHRAAPVRRQPRRPAGRARRGRHALLRKDFIVTDHQLVEARAAGADLALLIVAALDDDSLRRLHDVGREPG